MTETYTAVLSVHGIGRHRRHANAGALLAALEAVASTNDHRDLHTIIKVKPGVEPPRDARLTADVPMLRLRKAQRHHKKLFVGGSYRIYEVNWSPATRERLPIRSMMRWSIALLAATLRRDPSSWLSWPRLRLARLRLASEQAHSSGERHAFAVLASAYRNYRGSLGAQHRRSSAAKPSFGDFVAFAKTHAKTAATPEALDAAARSWRDTVMPAERSVRSAGRRALAGLAILTLTVIASLAPSIADAGLSGAFAAVTQAGLGLALLACLVVGLRFLTTIFSDVRYWTALSENDGHHETRNDILDRTVAMIRHLVSDPDCTRVVIVSHSLGTAIAYDALRAIGMHNLARKGVSAEQVRIRKLDVLITMGSPIDKLSLLFETTESESFREELLRDDLRGDLTEEPFWVGDRQRIKWINFWDPADPISDPLKGPLGTKPLGDRFRETSIENVRVVNTKIQSATASHTGYLANAEVAGRIFNEIFRSSNFDVIQPCDYAQTRRWSRISMTLAFVGVTLTLLGFVALQAPVHALVFRSLLYAGSVGIALSALSVLVVLAIDRCQNR